MRRRNLPGEAVRAALMLAVLALAGCASLDNAGSARYSVRPFMAGDRAICCEVAISNGKEIALLDATVIKRGDDYEVHLHEEGVAAFDGQRIAAGAARDAATVAAKAAAIGGAVLIAPIAAPALGAVMASGTLGAAAVGAGAAVLVDKAAAP
jgi:hypothetical protein